METVGLISLGCSRNLVDSEVMLGALKKAGFHINQDPMRCDVIIVNTCGFIEASKEESINTVLEMAELKKTGQLKKLVMAGCLVQRYADELKKQMPEVDLFIGTGEYPKIVSLLESECDVAVGKPRALADETLPRLLTTPKHYAYLKFAEGCQHACSFCIIPKLRGPLRSRSIDSLVIEANNFLDQGVRELNLIAQDSTGFGRDRKDETTLKKLFEALTELPQEKWIRLFYAYPQGFPMEVLDVMKDHPQICNYLDLPIQHINDRILKSMRREGVGKDVRDIIEAVRTKIPDLTLRTTFIVGYPTETKTEFEELLSFVEEGHFDHVGVFTYSPEEGTSAAKLANDVPDMIKQDRRNRLLEAQQKVSKQRNERWVGKTISVLVDGPSADEPLVITGRHQGQAPDVDGVVFLNECDLPAGSFAQVKITEAHAYDLVGEMV